jgi:hypothetical protein
MERRRRRYEITNDSFDWKFKAVRFSKSSLYSIITFSTAYD